jgi:DNA-binding response OmpR family regulator
MEKNCNIIIVENEWICAHFLKDILNELDYTRVAIMTNAQDTLTSAKKKKPDLVFMDINIEGSIDGIQCAKMLNQDSETPIIYVTGYSDSGIIKEASDTNLYGYLIKPFYKKDVEVVMQVFHSLINKREAKQVAESSIVQLDELYKYDNVKKALFINNNEIHLTKKELEVLDLLVNDINRNISYEKFKSHVWGSKEVSDSTIRDTISRLRKKAPFLSIENNIGIGYRLSKE